MTFSKIRGVGINLRLEYIDEVIAEKPDIPFFEVIIDNWFLEGPHHHKLEKICADYPIYFHCVGMNLGSNDELDQKYFQKLRELKKRYNPVHISDHLAVQKINGVAYHDLLPIPLTEDHLSFLENRIIKAQDLLGESIILENLSYYHEFSSSTISEFTFLNELVKRTDSGILLDLNNLWVNQKNLDIYPKAELEKLDFDLVKEIHLAGAEKVGNYYVDTHGDFVNDETLDLFRSISGRLGDIPIFYERDNNILSLFDTNEEIERIRNYIDV